MSSSYRYRTNTERNLYWIFLSLLWRHNDHDGVSNHQSHGCLLNRLFRRRSKKISKLRVTGLCVGNSPGPVNSPHTWPVTRKCFHLMTSSCVLTACSVSGLSDLRRIKLPGKWLIKFYSDQILVTGEFASQRPVTRNFDVFFDLHLNKRLSKQSRRRWFGTPQRSLWRHSNVILRRAMNHA